MPIMWTLFLLVAFSFVLDKLKTTVNNPQDIPGIAIVEVFLGLCRADFSLVLAYRLPVKTTPRGFHTL